MKYDLAVIGTGPAGISCLKSAVNNNLKTVVFEESFDKFGGTCVNCGCIPAKFFINASKRNISWADAFKQKQEILKQIKTPLLDFLKSKGVEVVFEKAKLLSENSVSAESNKYEAKNIVIATGSTPKNIISGENVYQAEKLFDMETLPESFLVVGAGYIGMEIASLLNAYGKKVTVVEKEKTILPFIEQSLAKRLKIILEKKGIVFNLAADVNDYNLTDFDAVLTAVGRSPNLSFLENSNVKLSDSNGWIISDKVMKTNIDNIFSCGDINGKSLLAYVAEAQGRICLDFLTGKEVSVKSLSLPQAVFSLPQVAVVGLTEQEAKAKTIDYTAKRSNFLRFSSSLVYNDQDGFIKVIVGKDEKILGVELISQYAADLANIFAIIINNGLTVEDVKKSSLIHPTISEIVCLLFDH